MTDQLPGRTPPWGQGAWVSPVRPPAYPVRIGDAERDEALDRLGDHFAAGRLTREELDERTETAMGARFDSDLEPLFRDLPDSARSGSARPARRGRSVGIPPVLMVLLPLLVIALVVSIVLRVPIFFGPVIWLLVLSRAGRQHHR